MLVPILDLEAEVNPSQPQLPEVGCHLVADRVGEYSFSELWEVLPIGHYLAEQIPVLKSHHN